MTRLSNVLRGLSAATILLAAANGCASHQQSESVSTVAAGTVDLSAYPSPTLDASEQQLLRGMSDADILGHFILVDSIEVVTADTLLRQSKSDDITTYARMMIAAHKPDIDRERQIAKETSITPTQIFGGLRASHIAASLDSVRFASEQTIDRHYVMSQVQLHSHVLAELETLLEAAKNQAVRDQIAFLMPLMRDHLAKAHALAVQKGFEKKRA